MQENKQVLIKIINKSFIDTVFLFPSFYHSRTEGNSLLLVCVTERKMWAIEKWYKLEEEMTRYIQHEMVMNDAAKCELSPCLSIFWVLYSTQPLLGFF